MFVFISTKRLLAYSTSLNESGAQFPLVLRDLPGVVAFRVHAHGRECRRTRDTVSASAKPRSNGER